MPEFFIGHIFVIVDGQTFQYKSLLKFPWVRFMLLYYWTSCYIRTRRGVFMIRKKIIVVTFNSTLRYMECVLSLTVMFHSHVESNIPSEFKIKSTTESTIFVLYFDILLKLDAESKLTTQLFDTG
jgi:hypothetical protein